MIKDDNVLVADWGNARVVLLSPTLTHLGNIIVPKRFEHHLSSPYNLHLDQPNHRLYIGEWTLSPTGRVFILEFNPQS